MITRAALLVLAAAATAAAQSPAPDLYTIELIGTPALQRFSGTAELEPAPSPFTVPVTAAGVLRQLVLISVDSLPDPRTLGPFTTFVAWAAPPNRRPIHKLGEVPRNATHARIGEVAFNRFTVFITAEANAHVSAPGDMLIMRGLSAGMRMSAAHPMPVTPPSVEHAHDGRGWQMPPRHPRASDMYMPALHGMTPHATPFLPGANPDSLPPVKPRSFMRVADGARIRLEAAPVRRVIRGKTIVMYAFNGQHPGPLIQVERNATIHVEFVNRTAMPTAVHWHGIRLDNRFDGVPHVTQDPVLPGDSFRYTIHFPDGGVYWYHPHHREDIQQDLGLYGNIMVRQPGRARLREEVLMLDDFLMGDDGALPYGAERATHALMGRFGNVLLINGEPAPGYRLKARAGEVIRLYFTNAANTRVFNISVPGARMKLVGSDVGWFDFEEPVESIVLAPAERYIVDVLFDSAGTSPIVNRVQAIDHTLRSFFSEEDTLGVVTVSPERAPANQRARFMRAPAAVPITHPYASHFERAPDHVLRLTMKDKGLPFAMVQMLRADTLFFNAVEWSGTMPMMDWLPTADQVEWVLRDEATGRENEDLAWRFKVGDLVRIRLVNDRHTIHAMAHPIHIHGQRFLVLAVNGRRTRNFVWKDTVLVPVGGVVELLLEVTNPGMWMVHCHIAEHLEAGMKTVFGVSR